MADVDPILSDGTIIDDSDFILIEDADSFKKKMSLNKLFAEEDFVKQAVETFNKNSDKPYKLRLTRVHEKKHWFENGRE